MPTRMDASPAEVGGRRWDRRELLVAALLVGAVWISFYPVLGCGFVNYDDLQYITLNGALREGLTWKGLSWGLTTFYFSNWHPLVWWSFLLDYQLYGLEPAGWHLTNLLWHLAGVVMLFVALRRLTGDLWPSALVAALFAVHPLNVQSVAWVSERKGVISGFFFMLTLWSYARYAERPSLGRYSLVGVSLALGLMAKQMLVTLPCVLLLLDFWPLARWPSVRAGRLVLEKTPLLALASVPASLMLQAQRQFGSMVPLTVLPADARLKNALVSYWVYLKRAFFPTDLAAYYPHPAATLPTWQAIAAATTLVAATALALGQARRRPFLAVGWFWYLGTLVPVIGLVQVGSQAQSDRYAYLPLIGVFIGVAWATAGLARTLRAARQATIVAGLALAGLMLGSRMQVRCWRNSIALWENAIRVTGGSGIANSSLAFELMSVDPEKAIANFEAALEFEPYYAFTHYNLGVLRMQRQQLEDGAWHLEQVIRIEPTSRFAQMAHDKLGLILMEQGKMEEAGAHLREAVRLDPEDAQSQADLGRLLARTGPPEEAAIHFRKALELKPDNALTYVSVGVWLLELGNAAQAKDYFEHAGRIRRDVAVTSLLQHSAAYLNQGKPTKAVACLRQIIALEPGRAEAHRELAKALELEGNAVEARKEYQEAVRLNSTLAIEKPSPLDDKNQSSGESPP